MRYGPGMSWIVGIQSTHRRTLQHELVPSDPVSGVVRQTVLRSAANGACRHSFVRRNQGAPIVGSIAVFVLGGHGTRLFLDRLILLLAAPKNSTRSARFYPWFP